MSVRVQPAPSDPKTEATTDLEIAIGMIRRTTKIRVTVRINKRGDYSYVPVNKKDAEFLLQSCRYGFEVELVHWPEGPILYIGTSLSDDGGKA